MTATGVANWVMLALRPNWPGGVDVPGRFNAGSYSGLSFWARGRASSLMYQPGTDPLLDDVLRVEVASASTVGTAEGGNCSDGCDDHHGVWIPMFTEWVYYQLSFSSLAQKGWGTAYAFDQTQIVGIQWVPAGNPDIWIDDVCFY